MTDAAEQVDLLDREGVPVARLQVTTRNDERWTHGNPTWLSRRSSRPFESLHRGPREVVDHTGVVVLESRVEERTARDALAAAGSRPLVLALLSLDGDVDLASLATARQVRDLASADSESVAAIAPVPLTFETAERQAVVASYARERPVFRIGHADAPDSSSGLVLFFTGLSGSGKSTLARSIRDRLLEDGVPVTLLDGDIVRQHLSAELGFSAEDRETNIRRVGWVSAEIAYHGGVAICSMIAPFEESRRAVQQMVAARGARFVLVHVSTPLIECERRDRKGLYARARRGEVPEFTGISSPYEVPSDPDLQLDTTDGNLHAQVDELLQFLRHRQSC